MECWKSFKGESWKKEINVRDFIQKNYTPFEGDSSFLEGPTKNTLELMATLEGLYKEERAKGVLDVEQKISSDITAYKAGYIDKNKETIVGLQTDAPLKRAIFPKGGINMMRSALKAYGYELDKETDEIFSHVRKTHNQGVFDVYTETMKKCRKSGIITGLPDAYGRGRIIGDYRRIALYGIDKLIEDKKDFLKNSDKVMDEKNIRLREETSDQIKSLTQLKEMALEYGFDISKPAVNAKEAIQWLYFGYLGAVKEQNGAAMSIGRTSSFLDIYIQRDLENGTLTEQEAQEMIDHFVMKLRIVRFLRTPDYNDLFSGDPTWVTESIAGMGIDGRTLVTKNSFRILNTLYNLGPAPEPNLTILWSQHLPQGFKEFATKVSYDTSSIQYENDDLMRPDFGDDYGIACCVSPMKIGKQMQFFGARVNLAKALLYAINGGKDEVSGLQVAPLFEPVTSEYLEFNEVMTKFDSMMEWLAEEYVKTLSVIHYMHDKYFYEAVEMSLHDHNVERMQATGIAGLSVVVDSLSAIKNARVKVIRNETGLAVDYQIEGNYIAFGNNDNDTDELASKIVKNFMKKVAKQPTYRDSIASQSILTITSNVVYGLKTGSTPDGRKAKEPFAPGANPMHGRDTKGAIASLASISKLPFEYAKDGISYTWAISPAALGKTEDERINNLISLLDGYFTDDGGQHLNVNVFDKALLEDAMAHPENYPQLTIRVSGYAVNFIKLTKQQQLDVISRTISSSM